MNGDDKPAADHPESKELGSGGGFFIDQFVVRTQTVDSPVGPFYLGNIPLLFGGCVGLGAAMYRNRLPRHARHR